MFATFKEQKKKGDSMLFDINLQTGDKTKTEGKYSVCLFIFLSFNIVFSDFMFFHVLLSDSGENENNQRTIVKRGKVWLPVSFQTLL